MENNSIDNPKDFNGIEVTGAEVLGDTSCVVNALCIPGEPCRAMDYFEMISECEICGRLF